MNPVLFQGWALLIGIVLIMLGNGMHFYTSGFAWWDRGFHLAEASDCHLGLFLAFPSVRALTLCFILVSGHVRVFLPR